MDGGPAAAVSSRVDSRGAARARAGPPPPVWFEFLERWRVTACSSPPPPLPLLLAGGPGPQPLLLPVQLRERPGPLPGPEAGQAAAAVGVTGPAAEGLARAPCARTCGPWGPSQRPVLSYRLGISEAPSAPSPLLHRLQGSLTPMPLRPRPACPPRPALFSQAFVQGMRPPAPCPLPPIVFGRICEGGCTPTQPRYGEVRPVGERQVGHRPSPQNCTGAPGSRGARPETLGGVPACLRAPPRVAFSQCPQCPGAEGVPFSSPRWTPTFLLGPGSPGRRAGVTKRALSPPSAGQL